MGGRKLVLCDTLLGVIHKSCGQLFEIFDPLPPNGQTWSFDDPLPSMTTWTLLEPPLKKMRGPLVTTMKYVYNSYISTSASE